MTQIKVNPKNWKIKLPLFPPTGVSDNSTISEYARCPRRGLYKYGLRRGFEGKSWAIQYGLAYHKYRETVEHTMFKEKCGMDDFIHETGIEAAIKGWEDPPMEHRHSYLNTFRLMQALDQARKRIEDEQKNGKVVVTRAEDSFDLEMPFGVCLDCGHAEFDLEWAQQIIDHPVDDEINGSTGCARCGSKNVVIPRHGGRVDAFIQWQVLNNANMIRDFKTTGYMAKNYEDKFDPNAQLQGYVWAGGMLSGRKFDGVLIETVYNTKTQGPKISQHYVTYSPGQMEAWLASQMMERQFIATMYSRIPELGYLAFPQRTTACQDYGGCRFRDACRTGSGFELENWIENYTIESVWDFTNPDEEESKT